MPNHISDTTFALVTFLTIFTWILVGYCIYLVWNTKKPEPNRMIGHVESITENEQGLSVEFRINDSEVDSAGIRHIREASIHSVSIVDRTAPGWQGRITHVDGKNVDQQ